MNTLAWIAALVATLWLAAYCENTLGERALAVAVVGLFLIELVYIGVFAVQDDIKLIWGKQRRDDDY